MVEQGECDSRAADKAHGYGAHNFPSALPHLS
jgi:hypothetical protein